MSSMEQMERRKRKSPLAPWLPVLGALMIVCGAIIGWVLSAPLMTWAVGVAPGFSGNELDTLSSRFDALPFEVDLMQFLFGLFIFLVFISLAALLVAVAIPSNKADKQSTEKKMKAEREAMLADQKRRKRRREEMNRRNQGR